MQDFTALTRFDFENKINKQEIVALQIIYTAMAGGVLLMAIVFVFLTVGKTGTRPETPVSGITLPDVFAAAVVLMAFLLYPLAYYLPEWQLKSRRLKSRLEKPFYDNKGAELTDPVAKIMYILRTIMVVRLAILESLALVGLTGLFLSGIDGTRAENWHPWIFITPAVIFFIYTVKSFPNKARIVNYIDTKILRAIRY
jgi:hypothetical protein